MKIDEEIKLAKQYYQQKRFQESGNLFESLIHQFENLNDYHKAAEMKNNASVAYLMHGDHQKAYELAKDSHLVFAQVNDDKNCGLALGNQASAMEHLGEKKAALALYQLAIPHLEKAGEKESKAYILKRISSLHIQQGNQLEALGNMTAALNNIDELSWSEKILKKLTDLIMRIGNN